MVPRRCCSSFTQGRQNLIQWGAEPLDALGLCIEVLSRTQPGFPDRWISGAFGKLAIPRGQFAELGWIRHVVSLHGCGAIGGGMDLRSAPALACMIFEPAG